MMQTNSMARTVLDAPTPNAALQVQPSAGRRAGAAWRVEIATDYAAVGDRWERLAEAGAAIGFQRRHWLSAWYETLGREAGVEPLLVTVLDAATGADVAAFPLVRRTSQRGRRVIEPADADMTDYNAPILGPDAPTSPAACASLLRAMFEALPPADLFTARKLPARIAGRPNPFVAAGMVVHCDATAHPLELGPDLADWEQRLTKKFKGDVRRKWHAFHACPGARLRIATDATEAAELLAALENLQARRIEHLSLPYILAEPPFRAFYRRVAVDGFTSDRIVVATLEAEGRVLAAAMGPRAGEWAAVTRLAIALEPAEMLRLSPGILLADGLIRALHDQGVRCVDFTIGSYDYKKRLRTAEEPLYECHRALSWRGVPAAAVARLRQQLKRHERVHALLRRLAGRR